MISPDPSQCSTPPQTGSGDPDRVPTGISVRGLHRAYGTPDPVRGRWGVPGSGENDGPHALRRLLPRLVLPTLLPLLPVHLLREVRQYRLRPVANVHQDSGTLLYRPRSLSLPPPPSHSGSRVGAAGPGGGSPSRLLGDRRLPGVGGLVDEGTRVGCSTVPGQGPGRRVVYVRRRQVVPPLHDVQVEAR